MLILTIIEYKNNNFSSIWIGNNNKKLIKNISTDSCMPLISKYDALIPSNLNTHPLQLYTCSKLIIVDFLNM
jgi:hypothetical protein